MNIQKCTCGIQLTTKNVKRVGRKEWDEEIEMLCLNCPKCKTSIMLIGKRKKRAA